MMTEAEEAQYNAMAEALAKEQALSAELKRRVEELQGAIWKMLEIGEEA